MLENNKKAVVFLTLQDRQNRYQFCLCFASSIDLPKSIHNVARYQCHENHKYIKLSQKNLLLSFEGLQKSQFSESVDIHYLHNLLWSMVFTYCLTRQHSMQLSIAKHLQHFEKFVLRALSNITKLSIWRNALILVIKFFLSVFSSNSAPVTIENLKLSGNFA